jgi:hypothetical protein
MLEEKPWKDQLPKKLGLTGEVQWILRIGYLKSYPDPVSLQMPVSRFVQVWPLNMEGSLWHSPPGFEKFPG